ncbi:unnamed protein product [Rhizophagus irregularis]|nr:unnamed protein product [Rhizophagus irregularis]
MEKERESLKKALEDGDIIYDSSVGENIYTVSNEELPEIINEWVNKYSETKEELAKDFNPEKDPSKPIKSCTHIFTKDKKIISVRLEVYPMLDSAEFNCSEKSFEYEFKVYHNKNQYQLKKLVQSIGIIADKEQDLERLIEKKENLRILLNLVTSKSNNKQLTEN